MIPRITVVVPTRERFETLHWAIKTCVTQDYDNLEILISDNASEDSTREVIEAYDDSRIRYLNPGRRLGMSEHWEFALSHVTSGFVAVIGDDDGLMPEAVREIAPLLVEDVPLVWPIQQYFWPTFGPDLANSVVLPLKQPAKVHELRSTETVSLVLREPSRYPLLPSPYFGIVPATALERIRKRSGTVFHSITPDIYAGFAIASVCDRYLYTDRRPSSSCRCATATSTPTGATRSPVSHATATGPASSAGKGRAKPTRPRGSSTKRTPSLSTGI